MNSSASCSCVSDVDCGCIDNNDSSQSDFDHASTELGTDSVRGDERLEPEVCK